MVVPERSVITLTALGKKDKSEYKKLLNDYRVRREEIRACYEALFPLS